MGPVITSFLLIVGLAHFSQAKRICAGCPLDKDVSDPAVHKYLTRTLSQYKAPVGTQNERIILVKVTKATSQVVSGQLRTYEFLARGVKTQKPYFCRLVLLDRVWVGEHSIKEYSCKPLSSKNKRSVLGEEEEIDLSQNGDLPELKELISNELNKQDKSKNLMGVVKFYKASKKVVAGLLIKARAEVAETNCPSDSTSSEKCDFKPLDHKVCDVEIWEKPWLNQKEVTKFDCSDVPHFCAGCPVEQNADDKTANLCLKRALFNLNNQPEATRTFNLKRVTRIQSQVVNGVKYTYEFEAHDKNKTPFTCRAVVFTRPWVSDEPTIAEFECSPLSNW